MDLLRFVIGINKAEADSGAMRHILLAPIIHDSASRDASETIFLSAAAARVAGLLLGRPTSVSEFGEGWNFPSQCLPQCPALCGFFLLIQVSVVPDL